RPGGGAGARRDGVRKRLTRNVSPLLPPWKPGFPFVMDRPPPPARNDCPVTELRLHADPGTPFALLQALDLAASTPPGRRNRRNVPGLRAGALYSSTERNHGNR